MAKLFPLKHLSAIAIKAVSAQAQDPCLALPCAMAEPWNWLQPWHVQVNLGLQAFSKCRHLVWFTPQVKVRIIFAISFHCPWCLIKQLLLYLRDVEVIPGFKESDSSPPELPAPCVISQNQTKQMSAAEHTEHFQGYWRPEQPLLALWAFLRLAQPYVAPTRAGRHEEEREYWCRRSAEGLLGLRDPYPPLYRKI